MLISCQVIRMNTIDPSFISSPPRKPLTDVFDPKRRKGVLRGYRGNGKSPGPAGFKFSGAFETSTKYFERMSLRNPDAEKLHVPKYGRKKMPRL